MQTPEEATVGVVLIVEDEPSVLELVRRVLVRVGHTVLVASDAGAAVRAAGDWQGPIDLLLTDAMMPAVRGPDLAATIATTRPDMRVLYMSGYAPEVLPAGDSLESAAAFLPKPFTAAVLIAAVARELSRAEP